MKQFLLPLKWIKKKICGERAKGFPIGKPKIHTYGKQIEDFNGWIDHVYKSSNK